MRVIVHAEDHSGRGDGHYTKPDLRDALDIFFGHDADPAYADQDGETVLTRADAEAVFALEHAVVFYDEDGDRRTISRDWATPL